MQDLLNKLEEQLKLTEKKTTTVFNEEDYEKTRLENERKLVSFIIKQLVKLLKRTDKDDLQKIILEQIHKTYRYPDDIFE